MHLGKVGWLPRLLETCVAAHAAGPRHLVELPEPGAPGGRSPRARARAWLLQGVRESGLLFGTPREVDTGSAGSSSPEEQLFTAVIRTFAELALDLAAISGAPPEDRAQQLLVLFGALTGLVDEAEEASRILAAGPGGGKLPRRLWTKIESALAERAMSLAGDPAYGLVLHNGAVYVDAQTLGRHALDYFACGVLHPRRARRRNAAAARQKALLVEVLAALACAERQPSYPARRAILRQIEDLKLPGDIEDALRARVKQFFERRPSPAAVVRSIRGQQTRRFLLQQTLLAARVDGRTSPTERAFLDNLARRLGFGEEEVRRIEVEVAEFYAKNRHVVDVFTVSAAAGVMGEEVVDAMQSALEKNFHRLMTEIRETGELSVLLSRVARGQTLTREERQRMRAQLLDIAKAIPALAIFAAPGGVLLLVALAKVLPFSLLPSAFQEEAEPGERDGAA